MRDEEPRPYTEAEVISQTVQMLVILAAIMGVAWAAWSFADYVAHNSFN